MSARPKFVPVWEEVTPEKAASYLARNTRNRPIRKEEVMARAKSMREGEFAPTHQGIAFDVHGDLVDGQHQLSAIVLSKKTQWLLVTRGLPAEAMTSIDGGPGRSIYDRLVIAGFKVERNMVPVAMRIRLGTEGGGGRCNPKEIAKIIETHKEAIEFTAPLWRSRRGGYVTTVSGIIARAWWTADRDRLAEFIDAYINPDSTVRGAGIARRLKDRIARIQGGGRSQQQEAAILTAWALEQFVNYRDVKRIIAAKEDPFPLPAVAC